MLTVIIAHKRNPANDRALAVALDCIATNTRSQYHLLVDTTTPMCAYQVFNDLARQATTEWVVFSNSDVFFAPDWDVPMLEAGQWDRIVTGVVVECGAIGVNVLNHHRDFGMRPETFDRAAFEAWVATESEVPGGEGWYCSSLHHRDAFLTFGGFDTSLGYHPRDPLDEIYWERWRAAGREVLRVPSFSYHLQRYSSEEEQVKAVRHA